MRHKILNFETLGYTWAHPAHPIHMPTDTSNLYKFHRTSPLITFCSTIGNKIHLVMYEHSFIKLENTVKSHSPICCYITHEVLKALIIN
jgi:hypothetical protein